MTSSPPHPESLPEIDQGDESEAFRPERKLSEHRVKGRMAAASDLGVSISQGSSYRTVAKTMGVSIATVASWCDPSDRRGPQFGDIYALALAGRTELASSILKSALAYVQGISSAQKRHPLTPDQHLRLLANAFGQLCADLGSSLASGGITPTERGRLLNDLNELSAKTQAAMFDLKRGLQ